MTQKSIILPELTEANRVEEVVRFVDGKTYHLIRLRPTVFNTFLRLCMTGARALSLAFIVMLAIYLPDYVFDYSNRGDDFLRMFFIYLGVMLAVVLAGSVMFVLMRPRTLYIDPEEKRITFARFFTAKSLAQQSIRFSDIVSLDKQIKASPLVPSTLTVIAQEQEFIVAEICYGKKDIHLIYEWLKPFFSLSKT
ncbi:MAG: hypothetical protein IIY06_12405 [Proteobacteria bacterium]|jgi:hypothetical protein|nr:hypothetical protein [Pseudomonadota bacterium]